MDIRQLSYLLVIAKHQNITKAAEELHMTQPTLSKIVKAMEEELGVTLLDRSGKAVKLTDAGEAAVAQIRSVLQAYEGLHTALDDVVNLKKGIVRIGLPPVIGSVFFPRILAGFRTQYPYIDFDLVEEGANKVESLLLEGALDMGVVVSPVDPERFDALPFLFQQLSLVIHESHPLAALDTVRLEELRGEPFVLFPRGFAVRRHVMRACRELGFEPSIVYESSQWDLLAEMVAARVGISIIPQAICSKITNRGVRTLELTDPVIPWNLVVIWPKHKYLSYAMREFQAYIREASAALPQ
ncbi:MULTISPECIES: LysR family transcriptional regulator [Paenibacillus]|uniref:LysR family transcriptional regulator n=1 Tax=Paenibacillus TaxID=44249 RepID=UPI0022B8AD80|nr:LysR family transcriptional regulator [Paenibacillus caseinilyticus]MCZ8520733.1 LysR family transcriptional regulator [Paenibacillus caseinilyticus]